MCKIIKIKNIKKIKNIQKIKNKKQFKKNILKILKKIKFN